MGASTATGSSPTEIGPGLSAVALDVVVDASGKIVAGGATTTTGAQDFALARYTTDGSLDPSFGGDGIVTTGFDAGTFERLGGVALAADGDIVAAGWTGAGCGASGCAFNFALARYDGDPPDIEVNVDIKPGSDENAVTPDKGTIPVGVLSTAVFDATSVDPSSVCFGDADVLSERDCTEEHDRGHVEDIDSDGRADLVLHFTAARVRNRPRRRLRLPHRAEVRRRRDPRLRHDSDALSLRAWGVASAAPHAHAVLPQGRGSRLVRTAL